MEIKLTILGGLIYLTMAVWLAAFAAYLTRRGKAGAVFFAAGSAVMLVAFVVRWYEVGHAPLQNLFEVFLCLGMLMYPFWLFCQKVLGARGPAANVLIGIVVLFPAAFVFKADPLMLPPALQSWLFIPHVTSYMAAYIILIMAGAQALMHLVRRAPAAGAGDLEMATYRMVALGFPLLTLGLILGAVWGKLAWGDYWNWDPKELWSLATWLVYVAYLHFRGLYGRRRPRTNSALVILGGVFVIITLLWVNLAAKIFPGMHVYAS